MTTKRSLLPADGDREFVDIFSRRFLRPGFAVPAVSRLRRVMRVVSSKRANVPVTDQENNRYRTYALHA